MTSDRGWLGIKALCPAHLGVLPDQPGCAPCQGCSRRSEGEPKFTFSGSLYFELPFFGQAARRSTRKQTSMLHSNHTPVGAGRGHGDARACCSGTPGRGSHLATRQRVCPRPSTVMGARRCHSFRTHGSDLTSDTRCSVGRTQSLSVTVTAMTMWQTAGVPTCQH